MQEKLKVLVSCYACSPFRGSEPGLGWGYINELSKLHNLHVIVEKEKWEADINRYLKENPSLEENLNFHFISKKRNRWLRKIWPPSYYWFYRKWQIKAYKLSKFLDKKENFDVVHQLNMTGFREPGYLWQLGKPFIWGPINGLNITPYRLLPLLGYKGFVFLFARNLINSFQIKFHPRVKKIAKIKNAILIASTPEVKQKIKKYWHRDSIIISEVGIKLDKNVSITPRGNGEPLRIVWVGVHVYRKALNILLKALSECDDINYELHILGSGDKTKEWKKMALQLEVNDNCKWHGFVELKKSHEIISNSHILCHSSLSDTTATVLLEALSMGKPIIGIKNCGYDHVFNKGSGISINSSSPSEVYNEYATEIKRIYHNDMFRMELANNAIDIAKKFTYEENAKEVSKLYHHVMKLSGNQ